MGGTAIRAPSDDLKNHTTVLTQLKEIAETGLGIRGNPASAYVKISDLVAAGLIKYISGVISPGVVNSATTVTSSNSITGTGTPASPLQLVGDSATPGNNMVYGTNGAGTKSWYAAPAGGSSPLTTKGDLYGFSTVNARLPVGSNGQVLTADSTQALGLSWAAASGGGTYPGGVVSGLYYWFEGDQLAGAGGSSISQLSNATPGIGAIIPANASSTGATIGAAGLNSLNVANFPGSAVGAYTFPQLPPGPLTLSTTFVVFKVTSNAAAYNFYSGTNNSLQYGTDNLSPSHLNLTATFVASIASGTTPLAAGTWYQANATYNASSGAYAFRLARASDGSGTSVHSITAATSVIGYNSPSASQYMNGSIAELILYSRVLTPTEITAVENYLFAKWGV